MKWAHIVQLFNNQISCDVKKMNEIYIFTMINLFSLIYSEMYAHSRKSAGSIR